ncbi:class I SAM-dependent methyltransferase [Pseudarthrobacter sp. J1763]|uniref:class I SAM-dependent methyltransferase n=1 Tax=Pseudarthrobacter sp. J1763 TaxID=3420445 RepID=UPI003D2C66B9
MPREVQKPAGYDDYNDELLAAIYDADNPDGPDHDYFRSLAAKLKAERITDLGCGTGILTVTLSAPGRTVVGIDPAAAMLDRATSRPNGASVEWRLGTSNLIDDGENDLILMTGNVAMHILGEGWHATLKDIARGLKPGGKLAFETRNPKARAWTTWNEDGTERSTAVGRLWETTAVTAPDAAGWSPCAATTNLLTRGTRPTSSSAFSSVRSAKFLRTWSVPA